MKLRWINGAWEVKPLVVGQEYCSLDELKAAAYPKHRIMIEGDSMMRPLHGGGFEVTNVFYENGKEVRREVYTI